MEKESLAARQDALRELRTIPGIGPSLASDLYLLGIRRVTDLKTKNPETLYRDLETLTASHQDRCVLYTFRCAVYYAKTKHPRADLLLWWNWKDVPTQAPARKVRASRRR